MPATREYEDSDGKSPFTLWFEVLDGFAAAKVSLSVAKLEAVLKPNVKSVGKGVHESRSDFGPGYRVYFPALSKETHIPEKSLMRMVGPRGNPTASNLFAIVAALQHQTHVETHVEPHAAEVKPAHRAKQLAM